LLIMSTPTPPLPALHLVVGYDGSPPADRAHDAAVNLLRGRTGRIDVVYVAHLTSTEMMSASAVGEMEVTFEEVEKELRVLAAEKLGASGLDWGFYRRQGPIAGELIAVASAISHEHPGDTVVIVVGSSSSPVHRMVGSAPVSLARHSPVPLVVVP
jgi:nucleotide-binding universal stress UspA family protein